MVILIFSQLATLKHVIKSGGSALNLLTRITNCTTNASLYSTESSDKESTNELSVDKNESMISDSMKAYLKRAEAYDEFIQKEEADYELGKLHLANMMGENPETFTQKRIDKAISYLFPSGLFDKRARPIMGNPKEIIPPKKAAEFDSSGRPYHSLFYTTRPNYYQTLYNIVEQLHILNDIEDNMNFNDIKIEGADQLLDLNTYDWISYNSFQNLILEEITTAQYEYFISSMEKLVEHPCSNKAKDFIMNFKKSKKTSSQIQVIPKLMEDVNNRPFVIVKDCKRKTARGSVILRGKGSGIITVNGIPLTNYFQNFQECEQVR